jgi:hypothetical protein
MEFSTTSRGGGPSYGRYMAYRQPTQNALAVSTDLLADYNRTGGFRAA